MLIFVVNAGSSTLKCNLIDPKTNREHFTCLVDRIGQNGTTLTATMANAPSKKTITLKTNVRNVHDALKLAASIMDKEKITGDARPVANRIVAIGHRVVHGGDRHTKPTRITPTIIQDIAALAKLAPLHNPPNLDGIRAAQRIFPHLPHVAVFDTGFYATLPEHASHYAIPETWHRDFGIRRYGFHGISHEYVTQQALHKFGGRSGDGHNSKSGGRTNKLKIITCHLGNGCSITASINGKAIDTSMGFTPLEGIVMGTRSGTIDPAAIPFLAKKLKKPAEEIITLLNKECGLKGVSGISGDMRDIRAACLKNNKNAQRAYNIFTYRIALQIAAFTAAMQGLDILVFTAGIGENAAYVRRDVTRRLTHLQPFKTIAIKTNEAALIAQKTLKATQKSQK